jgi:hypothetical protein
MELNLTSAQKLQSLEGSEVSLSHEIYNLLLRINLDPDAFQASDLDSMDQSTVAGYDGEIMRLRKLLAAYTSVKAKIQSLS